MSFLMCGSQLRQAEGTCKKQAGWGTDHPGTGRCRLHGGSTPSHVKAAAYTQARAAMVTYGQPVDVGSGIDALWEELRYTAGHVEWLRDQIQQLEPAAITWGLSKRLRSAGETLDEALDAIPEITETAGTHVLVKLYLEERRHKVDVAARIVSLGLDEKRIQLEQDKGLLLAEGLRWMLGGLALTGAQLELANTRAVQMLRALAAGQAPELVEASYG